MKRFLAFCVLCSLLSAGAFFVLILEDRRLGIALPYSVPLAFASMLLLTPMLHALARQLPQRVAAVPDVAAPAMPLERAPHQRRPAQGVVLLDLSATATPAEGGA